MIDNWRVGLSWPEIVNTDECVIEYLFENEEGKTESEFDEGLALAAMLIDGAVFLNCFHWETDWPEEARKTTAICVVTNDIFAWGCADAEGITYHEIEEVYRYWVRDRSFGCAVWAIIRNKELPQKPVADAIRKAGIWDLDVLQKEHNLRANHYDGISGVWARRKRAVYEAWYTEIGEAPLPYDGDWLQGWNRYTAAHPDWYDEDWKAADKIAVNEWRSANGYETR